MSSVLIETVLKSPPTCSRPRAVQMEKKNNGLTDEESGHGSAQLGTEMEKPQLWSSGSSGSSEDSGGRGSVRPVKTAATTADPGPVSDFGG